MNDIDEKNSMHLAAYIKVSSQGFALPLYKSAPGNANAWYVAIPSIQRDHLCDITGFEMFNCDGDNLHLLPESSCQIVCEGSSWIDVFNHNDHSFVGPAKKIFDEIEISGHKLLRDAPISFLNLALAAEVDDETTRSISIRAKSFLTDRLSPAKTEQFFQTVILQPRIMVEVERISHEAGSRTNADYRKFSIEKIDADHYRIILKFNKNDWLADKDRQSELQTKLREFAKKLEVAFSIEFLNSNAINESEEIEENQEIGKTVIHKRIRTRWFGLVREIAIDLGTTNTRIYKPNTGIVVDAPTVIATQQVDGKMLPVSVGQEAEKIADKPPEAFVVNRPVRDGKVVDVDLCAAMLSTFLSNLSAPLHDEIRPLDVVVSTTLNFTQAQRNGLLDAVYEIGAKKIYVVPQVIAAAIGSGLEMDSNTNAMVVHVGGGIIELALISAGEVAASSSVFSGGERADKLFVDYVRRNYNLLIPLSAAKLVKDEFGCVIPPEDGAGNDFLIKGRDLVNGVPKEINLYQAHIYEAIASEYGNLIEAIRLMLEETPPGLASTLIEDGILVSGGAAQVDGLMELIEKETGIPARLSDNPETCVIKGLRAILETPDLRRLLGKY